MLKAVDVDLSISADQACFIILKARQFAAKEWPLGCESGSNASDDGMPEVLEMRSNDPVFEELRSFIDSLSADQQIDLVALTWVGRGDYAIGEWAAARAEAEAAHTERTADYLLGMPLLSEFLEDALAEAGRNCTDEAASHLSTGRSPTLNRPGS